MRAATVALDDYRGVVNTAERIFRATPRRDVDELAEEGTVIIMVATCGQGELPGNCRTGLPRGRKNMLEQRTL